MFKNSLSWAIGLVIGCVVCMVGFNVLGEVFPELKKSFTEYANHAFDCLKALFGMVLGVMTEKFHNKKTVEAEALKAEAEAMKASLATTKTVSSSAPPETK